MITEFPDCPKAGPTIREHPGRRMCESPRMDIRSVGVDAQFCNSCIYRERHLAEARAGVVTSVNPLRRRISLPVNYRQRPCAWEGPIVQWCPREEETRHIRHCNHETALADGKTHCARQLDLPPLHVQRCAECASYEVDFPLHFDHYNLAPNVTGKRFNAGLTQYGDEYLLAWRNGWAGSRIYLTEVTSKFTLGKTYGPLNLEHTEASFGHEDARLFWHNGDLYVAFIGVVGGTRIRHTSQLYARLNDKLEVAEVFYPYYKNRNLWEKNWSFFSHDGNLYAVYSINPHRVLKIEKNSASLDFDTGIWYNGWTGGDMRGSTPPVRVGSEYWVFFHDRVLGQNRKQCYRTWLYTFEAQPPFRPTRILKSPLISADAQTNLDNYADVIFTCGAVLNSGNWYLSSGVHDRYTEIRRFTHAELVEGLLPVPS